MAKGTTWKTVLAGGVLAAAGMLSGCDAPAPTLNKIDVANAEDQNAVGTAGAAIRSPDMSVSNLHGIDWADAKQVDQAVQALGLTSTCGPHQAPFMIESGWPRPWD